MGIGILCNSFPANAKSILPSLLPLLLEVTPSRGSEALSTYAAVLMALTRLPKDTLRPQELAFHVSTLCERINAGGRLFPLQISQVLLAVSKLPPVVRRKPPVQALLQRLQDDIARRSVSFVEPHHVSNSLVGLTKTLGAESKDALLVLGEWVVQHLNDLKYTHLLAVLSSFNRVKLYPDSLSEAIVQRLVVYLHKNGWRNEGTGVCKRTADIPTLASPQACALLHYFSGQELNIGTPRASEQRKIVFDVIGQRVVSLCHSMPLPHIIQMLAHLSSTWQLSNSNPSSASGNRSKRPLSATPLCSPSLPLPLLPHQRSLHMERLCEVVRKRFEDEAEGELEGSTGSAADILNDLLVGWRRAGFPAPVKAIETCVQQVSCRELREETCCADTVGTVSNPAKLADSASASKQQYPLGTCDTCPPCKRDRGYQHRAVANSPAAAPCAWAALQ